MGNLLSKKSNQTTYESPNSTIQPETQPEIDLLDDHVKSDSEYREIEREQCPICKRWFAPERLKVHLPV